MGFLNDAGVTTLWSRIKNYMTGDHVKTLAVNNATNVDEALTALNTGLTTQSEQITNLKATDDAFESGLAVVADGDTHAAIINGQYVYIKNHDSLAEGLYTANDDIDTDGALSGKVTAVSGGLNALKSNIDTLNSKVTQKVSYDTAYDITLGQADNMVFYADKINRTLFVEMVFFTNAEDIPANSLIGHVVNAPSINRTHWSAVTSTGVFVRFVIDSQCRVFTETSIPGNVWVSTSIICLINA